MATTTNYSWTTPDDTGLVKDGASAIRTLGTAIDTTTKALNPETTLGDIAYRSSSANVKTRLGIGTTGQVLSVVGGVPAWASPAGGGKVLQVVQASTSTNTTVASTSLTDTGLSCNITPSSASSKILVLVNQNYFVGVASNVNISFAFSILRGATQVFDQPVNGGNYWNLDVAGLTWQHRNVYSATYLDSPATTSSTTYKTQGALNNTSNRELKFQNESGVSTITLLEIGA
jgi:hypothetical protein